MSCESNRSEIRDVALGAAPSRRLEAHVISCLACRDLLARERGRLAEIEAELGEALAVEPSPSLLPRVREVASRQLAREPQSRLVWLLPVAASIVALAALLPLARRIAPVPGRTPVAPSPSATPGEPPLSRPEVPVATVAPRPPSPHRRGEAHTARAAAKPEVIVPPGGEATLRRYVQAIRHSRIVDEVVLGTGPDPVDWTEPPSVLLQPRTVDRIPGEMQPPTAGTEALTLGD